MVGIRQEDLHRACQVLFGPEVDASPDFLSYIQPSGIKSAFRRLARITHPDASGEDSCNDRFIEARWAYERLKRFIELRELGSGKSGSCAGNTADIAANRATSHASVRHHGPAGANSHTRSSAERAGQSARRGGNFYQGALPERRLLFGEYLFYRGEVSWETLVRAIAWQRGQRPQLGSIARQWGWLGEDEIAEAQRGRGPGEPLGEALVRLGLISRFQLHSILMLQRRMQKPFGEYFVLNGHLSRERLNRVLYQEFLRHNASF